MSQHRIKRFKLVADWFKSHLWPHQIRRDFYVAKHMTNTMRFRFICFALGNGMSEYTIRQIFNTYALDQSAWRQINYIFDNYKKKSWTCWNITLRRSAPVY